MFVQQAGSGYQGPPWPLRGPCVGTEPRVASSSFLPSYSLSWHLPPCKLALSHPTRFPSCHRSNQCCFTAFITSVAGPSLPSDLTTNSINTCFCQCVPLLPLLHFIGLRPISAQGPALESGFPLLKLLAWAYQELAGIASLQVVKRQVPQDVCMTAEGEEDSRSGVRTFPLSWSQT